MPQSRCSSPIIVALDFATAKQACDFAKQINPENTRLKVGKALFTQAGPALLTELHQLGFEVFLDLKFHDIPNTVANACLEAANLGVWMINVHASGGRPMLETVMNRLQTLAQRPKVIAVTVLTSMSQTTFHEIGFIGNIEEQVLHLARLSQDCGLDGVVCSAREAQSLKQQCGDDFLLITPGIRPSDNAQSVIADDQTRIMTPEQAMQAGADYLVIGRPIIQTADPARALASILTDLAKTSAIQQHAIQSCT